MMLESKHSFYSLQISKWKRSKSEKEAKPGEEEKIRKTKRKEDKAKPYNSYQINQFRTHPMFKSQEQTLRK